MSGPGSALQPLPPHEAGAEVFHHSVVPIVFSDAVTVTAPDAVIVIGKPGSGAAVVAGTLPGSAVLIDTHDLEAFHRDYLQLSRQWGPAEVSILTSADVHQWLTMSVAHAVSTSSSVVVVDRSNDPDRAIGLAQRLSATHRVSFAFLATQPVLDQLTTLESHQLLVESAGLHPAATGSVSLDDRDGAIARIADWVDSPASIGIVDSVLVYPSATAPPALVRSRTAEHRWVSADPATSTVVDAQVPTRRILGIEQCRRLDLEQSRRALDLHRSLTARMDPSWRPMLNELRASAQPLLHPGAVPHRSVRIALTFGRFQVFTTQHLDVILGALQTHSRVVVGVIDPTLGHSQPGMVPPPRRLAEFYLEHESALAAENNPLATEERIWMVRAAIAGAGLDAAVSVIAIPPPQYAPDAIPAHLDVVLPLFEDDAEASPRSHAAFTEILGRPVLSVASVPFHNADPRAVYLGGGNIAPLIPAGAFSVLAQIGGFPRVFVDAPPTATRVAPIASLPPDVERRINHTLDAAVSAAQANPLRTEAGSRPNPAARPMITQAGFDLGAGSWAGTATGNDPATGAGPPL